MHDRDDPHDSTWYESKPEPIEHRCPPGTGVAIAVIGSALFWIGLVVGWLIL